MFSDSDFALDPAWILTQLVGDLGLKRHEFADIKTRHVGLDGLKLATNLRRRFRLRSYMSTWLGPPFRQTVMTAFGDDVPAAAACTVSRSASDKPGAPPMIPTLRKSRRLTRIIHEPPSKGGNVLCEKELRLSFLKHRANSNPH